MALRPKFIPSEEDMREIFALFSSPTDEERQSIYEPSNPHYFSLEDLGEEYNLTQERREFADDAWRAVTYFLYRRGFTLTKNEIEYDLLSSSGYSNGPA
jgi:hypothetical protein